MTMLGPYWDEAEALVAPWSSRAAFETALTTVDRRRFADWLRPRLFNRSAVPDLESELAWVWPVDGESLLAGLQRIARRLLTFEGDTATLAVDPVRPGREILRWRCISLRFPAGLLVAAATTSNVRPQPRVRVLPRGIGPNGPVALQHLHYKAALSFEFLWSHIMGRPRRLNLAGGDAAPGFQPEEWRTALCTARAARQYLRCRDRGTPGDPTLGFARRTVVERAVERLRRGDASPLPPRDEIELWRQTARRRGIAPRDFWSLDPLDDGGAWPEGALLAAALDRALAGDHELELLLVQYMRVKCLLHCTLTQDPKSPGLDAFASTFDRLRPYRDGIVDRHLVEAAFDEPMLDLRAVELRTGPPRATELPRLAGLARRVAGDPTTGREAGWVFHIIRDAANGPPREPLSSRARRLCAQVRGIRTALSRRPELLAAIRGLDVASQERKGELWLVADALRETRQLSNRAAARSGFPPLQLTVHVGEDFPHLMTGLRWIHEPILWALVQRGDRLGHALALGEDPRQWAERHVRVCMPRWVRLLDVSWVLDRVASGDIDLSGTTIERLRAERCDHAAALGAGDLSGLHASLGAPGTVREHSGSRARRSTPVESLISRRLAGPDDGLGGEAVSVETGRDVPVMEALRHWLACHVAAWQLVLEVNPTSNHVVGNLNHPLAQSLFRLRPLEASAPHTQRVSINTDDPLTFATCLADEYAYAWAGMVIGMDVAPAYARSWLDDAAATGWASRFTLRTDR